MKRFLDILLSLFSLILLLPFGLIISIILRLTGEGEIFFVHPRMGKNGKPFGLIKFASMLKDSPNLGTGDITTQNDPRVLPFGRFLRKTKINELPQIINVLKGDMSIIGPRPLTPKNFDYYPDEVKEIICRMRPGLSGIGSIIFRDEEKIMADSGMPYHKFYKKHISPYKGRLEIWYERNRSLWIDMMLLVLTIWVILFPETKVVFRLFKSLPQVPDFLKNVKKRKSGTNLVGVRERISKVVEIKSSSRSIDRVDVLK